MNTDNWAYLYGKPEHSADIKLHAEDFIVRENLGYSPCGEGEHIYLWLRKSGLNTAYVAEQLAKFARLPLRAVSYAGRKDKHAVTEQWFGIHKPGKTEYDWSEFDLPGAQILRSRRHNKKLRTGVLKSNTFELVVRNLSGADDIEQRLINIQQQGVPNYFGQQRFGDSKHHASGGNLALAQRMLDGEEIRNRNKRSMAISAMRAWLFNQFVSERLSQQTFNFALPGDVFNLCGSNSFFVANDLDSSLDERMKKGDIAITAPMWGKGQLASVEKALAFEHNLAQSHKNQCELLEKLALKQERRSIALRPQNMTWQVQQQTLKIKFELPAGCFATSVLREVVNLRTMGQME